MTVSLISILVSDSSLPRGLRTALEEDRFEDAAHGLIEDFGLTCGEVHDLLGTHSKSGESLQLC
jgi:hypothetical protein